MIHYVSFVAHSLECSFPTTESRNLLSSRLPTRTGFLTKNYVSDELLACLQEEHRRLLEAVVVRNNSDMESMLVSSLQGRAMDLPLLSIQQQQRRDGIVDSLNGGILDTQEMTRSLWVTNYEPEPSLLLKEASTASLPDGASSLLVQQQQQQQHDRRSIPEQQVPGVSFPTKLFVMLNKAEQGGYSDIISFLPSGESFKIHKPILFAQEIMPKFFKTRRYTSFQKQLSLYGFKKIRDGPDVGAIGHEYLRRDDQMLVAKIHRQKKQEAIVDSICTSSTRSSSNTDALVDCCSKNDDSPPPKDLQQTAAG